MIPYILLYFIPMVIYRRLLYNLIPSIWAYTSFLWLSIALFGKLQLAASSAKIPLS